LSVTPQVLTQMVRGAFGPRTEATASHTPPLAAGVHNPDPTPVPQETIPGTPEPVALDPGIVNVLAEKVLLAWLRNRYQLLFPLALELHRLDRAQSELLFYAMVSASHADGCIDGKERERIEGAMDRIDFSDEERSFLATALAHPKPLNEILAEARDVYTSALVYAASLMAVDQRKQVNRYFLKYLAARLQLSEELVESLGQRFGSSG
jgi:Protein of unknown function (DUF533)